MERLDDRCSSSGSGVCEAWREVEDGGDVGSGGKQDKTRIKLALSDPLLQRCRDASSDPVRRRPSII